MPHTDGNYTKKRNYESGDGIIRAYNHLSTGAYFLMELLSGF